MDVYAAIFKAAKLAGVSAHLLVAICAHESGDFKLNYAAHDGGSASYGVCQIKKSTASMLGFKGPAKTLMDPKVSALFAAKYLRYQQDRYGDNWLKAVASYNSGTYNPSDKVLGCPRNLKYIKRVQDRLPFGLKHRLSCGRN